jgi:hypothetical protein
MGEITAKTYFVILSETTPGGRHDVPTSGEPRAAADDRDAVGRSSVSTRRDSAASSHWILVAMARCIESGGWWVKRSER